MEKKTNEETNKSVEKSAERNVFSNDILINLDEKNNSLQFKIIRPGWNETVLIDEMVEDQARRKEINDAMMEAFSNHETWDELVEQVWFVSYDKENPRLMMAWWEFCGNATRSFVRDLLDWKPWETEVEVSGVENKLKAWVKETGDAWSQMPIYPEFEKIYPSELDKNWSIVEMEWITHLVTTSKIPFDADDPDFSTKIKDYAFNIIKEHGLTKFPAAWVMFLQEDGKWGYHMTPVVYVKSIDTLFLEWACWSWTTAVGLLLSKEKQETISDFPITQYSWVPINVTVRVNDNKEGFEYADISWPVENIFNGSMKKDLKNKLAIQDSHDEKSLSRALKEWGLIDVYKELFWDKPYFEEYTDEEVTEIFENYRKNWELYLWINELKIIGFWASLPFKKSPIKDVEWLEEELVSKWVDIDKCLYMADLWVKKSHQRKWIAKDLVQARIKGKEQGSSFIMRTSIENYKSQWIYKELNFKPLDTKQEVNMKRNDGTGERTDERLFLISSK